MREELYAPAASRYYWSIFLLAIERLLSTGVGPKYNPSTDKKQWDHSHVHREINRRPHWRKLFLQPLKDLFALRIQADYEDVDLDYCKLGGVHETALAVCEQIKKQLEG